jgi:oxygen-dependent protoporphyrinogen oxidase
MTKQIVVVGGGLSGLAAAYRLKQRLPHAALTLLEGRPHLGGNIGTLERDGFRIELGPNGIFDAKPHTLDLCRDLGLQERLIVASDIARRNRYLFLNGRIQRLPNSLWSFLTTGILSWRAKFNLLWEKYRRSTPAPNESIAAFARRRAGREVADTLADAFVTGIHAGDSELLSVAAAFPRLVELERTYGSVSRGIRAAGRERRAAARARGEQPQPPRMWSFREGLQVLIDALHDALRPHIQTATPVTCLERTTTGWLVHAATQCWPADAVVLTTPSYHQAELVRPFDELMATTMQEIPYTKVAVVVVGYHAADCPRRDLDGFGYLTPQKDRRDILGVQWCSSIYPDRAPHGMVLWRALCGGWNRGEMLDWDDAKLLAAVRAELQRSMGVRAEPTLVHIVRWPRAIPQYTLGHLERVATITSQQRQWPGLFLGGNAYRGVAMNDCCEDALRLAEQVAAQG